MEDHVPKIGIVVMIGLLLTAWLGIREASPLGTAVKVDDAPPSTQPVH